MKRATSSQTLLADTCNCGNQHESPVISHVDHCSSFTSPDQHPLQHACSHREQNKPAGLLSTAGRALSPADYMRLRKHPLQFLVLKKSLGMAPFLSPASRKLPSANTKNLATNAQTINSPPSTINRVGNRPALCCRAVMGRWHYRPARYPANNFDRYCRRRSRPGDTEV